MTICSKHNIKKNKWYQCKKCQREYSQTPKGKESLKRARRKYQTSPKGKLAKIQIDQKRRNTPAGKLHKKIYSAVLRAIRKGKLIKQPCVICHNIESEAHHAWGCVEEHSLHVVFLCSKHHRLANKDKEFNELLK